MIGRLRGILVETQVPTLIVDVGGVGYEVFAPLNVFDKLPKVGEEVVLLTHMIVREDVQALYGFINKRDKQLFRELIKVSGIGPKLALAILSSMSPDEFIICISSNDTGSLTQIPGIGKKMAERMVVELRGLATNFSTVITSGDNKCNDAITALVSLGYKLQDAQKAVYANKNQASNCEELIRLSLKQFHQQKVHS